MLSGRILITGGTGYLGRGIMRRARRDQWQTQFTILSRDEKKQAECRAKYPEARYVLGDVCDINRLTLTMLGHDTVIHAAALKYIPEGEFNADECVRVNIDGARCVIDAARAAGIGHVVGISTDKAAQPINVYGMTKAVMERLFAEAADGSQTIFTTCRYGNVIGSTGSVVPVMRAQFAADGFVRITDPHMTRFWMPIDDAVDTIVAALDAIPGSVTVPEPKGCSMRTLAYAVLGSMGQNFASWNDTEEDPRIHVIGARPGEKQHEDLVTHYEMLRSRTQGGYIRILPVGNEDYQYDVATLSSNNAKYVERETLVEWIADSVYV